MDNDNDRSNGYRGARPVYRETVYDNFPEDRRSDRQIYEDAMIRRRIRERRRAAERRRVKRNRTVALVLLIVIIALIAKGCSVAKRKKLEKAQAETSEAEKAQSAQEEEQEQEEVAQETEEEDDDDDGLTGGHRITQVEGMTYVDNILVVNKTYSVPADYEPGVSAQAKTAFQQMSDAAVNDGVYIEATVSYVSYSEQKTKYRNSALSVGVAETDWKIERPGYSEHQTGLAFDVNANDPNFATSPQGQWLAAHCCEYGFILRYPQGKEAKTGYDYDPWHIRYVGVEDAKAMTSKGLCLEEYLGITSDYTKGSDGLSQDAYAKAIGAEVSRADAGSAAYQINSENEENASTEAWYDDTYTEDYGYTDYGYDPTYDYGYDPNYDYGYEQWY